MSRFLSRFQYLRNTKKATGNEVIFMLLLMLLALLFMPQVSSAQSKDDLGKKKKQIESEISYANKLLKETEKNKEASLNQLATLQQKIKLRQNLIYTINREVLLISRQIDEQNDIISSLEEDLKKIKAEYAKMIYYGYKNKNSYNKLIFLFSSKDFNQAYQRLKYLQQYEEYRKKQAELILYTKDIINKKIKTLESKKEDKKQLSGNKEKEKQTLAEEKQEQGKVYETLQSKENQLRNDIKTKQKEARKLQKAIEDIIAEEIRKAREASKLNKGFALTPKEEELSASFEKNKGKLPWPVERGIITGKFGEQEHPVLKGIKINNNGIEIGTNKGAVTRAVFEGTVTGIVVLPGANKMAVIIRHGGYFSVYGNLSHVYVKKGDNVYTKQDIGLTYYDEKKSKTEAHLEIWKLSGNGSIKVDPEKWLVKE